MPPAKIADFYQFDSPRATLPDIVDELVQMFFNIGRHAITDLDRNGSYRGFHWKTIAQAVYPTVGYRQHRTTDSG